MSLHQPLQRFSCALLLGGSLLVSAWLTTGQTQVPTTITPDSTLGTVVTQSGNVYNITGGTQPANGPNLFHSFGRFSVSAQDTARFSGPSGVANILARVTGGQMSEIHGLLQSSIPGADLYLLNPSGVVFGPNARLDVSGSFHVGTADYLRLEDGAQFFTHLSPNSVLTVAPPAAFGFLGNPPAPITFQPGSTLGVPEGHALSAVGGEIQVVGGTLRAPGGRLHLASTASPGEVAFSPLELAPDLRVEGFARLGRIELSQRAVLDVNGTRGGAVLLRGGRIRADGSSIQARTQGGEDGSRTGIDLRAMDEITLTNSAVLQTGTTGAGWAGDIRLTAGSVQVEHSAAVRSTINTPSEAERQATGAGGDIVIQAGRLTLANGAEISSASANAGRAGGVSIMASEEISIIEPGVKVLSGSTSSGAGGRLFIAAPTVTMGGLGSQLTSGTTPGSSGDAGAITVEVGRLTLTGGALISTGSDGTGRGGALTIVATDAISITGRDLNNQPNRLHSGNDPRVRTNGGPPGDIVIVAPSVLLRANAQILAAARGNADAGHIRFQVGSLTLTSGVVISASSFGAGRAGDITIMASEGVSLMGTAAVFSDANAGGAAGRIVIAAPKLSLEGNPSGIAARLQTRTGTNTSGDAGAIVLQVGRLTLTGRATIETTTAGSGRGGNIRIVAREIELKDDALITASSSSTGAAGMIQIEATETFRSHGGRVTTASDRAGDAGAIVLQVGRLTLTGRATIETTTAGSGRGGNIRIVAREIELKDDALITARSTGTGAAGRIRIEATEAFRSHGGRVTTASDRAGGGEIELRAGSLVLLLDNTAFTTAVQGGEGNAGDITLDAPVIVIGGSQVIAQASEGRGGNIRIGAGVFLADPVSLVDASSRLGIDGEVDIQAPVADLSGTVTPLPQELRPAATLLQNRCAARLQQGRVGSLVERGRSGIPRSPDGTLPSRLPSGWTDTIGPANESSVAPRSQPRPAKRKPLGTQFRPASNDPSPAQDRKCLP